MGSAAYVVRFTVACAVFGENMAGHGLHLACSGPLLQLLSALFRMSCMAAMGQSGFCERAHVPELVAVGRHQHGFQRKSLPNLV